MGVITLNPTDKSSYISLSADCLTITQIRSGGYYDEVRANISKSTGKWYWEVLVNASSLSIGVANSSAVLENAGTYPGGGAYNSTPSQVNNGRTYMQYSGAKYYPSSTSAFSCSVGDTIGIALDLDSVGGSLVFYKNGVLQSGSFTDVKTLGQNIYPFIGLITGGSGSLTVNFGATPFKYSTPTGYLSYQNIYKYLVQQGTDIYAIKSSFYGKVGQTPVTENQFLTYGTNDLSALTTSQTQNTSIGVDDGTLGSGKYFAIPFNSDYQSINTINTN